MSPQIIAPNSAAGGGIGKELVVLALVAGVVVLGYTRFGDALNLVNLARQESQLRAFQEQHSLLGYGIAILVYVVVTGLSLPGDGIGAVFTASQLTQIVIAFALLGVFPLAVRWLMKLFSRSKPTPPRELETQRHDSPANDKTADAVHS